jgi:ATP-dependent RNA helicase RhlE
MGSAWADEVGCIRKHISTPAYRAHPNRALGANPLRAQFGLAGALASLVVGQGLGRVHITEGVVARQGLDAVAIHSDRTQPERTRALDGFRNGTVRVLVATDVAARGLDIEDLPHVVNFELPWQAQDYIHRIGRTGRAGQAGDAISLVSIDEVDLLRGVQRLLKIAIPWTVEQGFVPDRNVEPRPLRGGDRIEGRRERREPRQVPVRRRAGAA